MGWNNIPQNVDGPKLAQNLTEVYEVSQKSSPSERIPFFGKWQKVMPDRRGNSAYLEGEHWDAFISEGAVPGIFYNFSDVQEYLKSHFGPGEGSGPVGNRPAYDSYQAHQLIREQFTRGGVVYTFKHLPAPDSLAVLNGIETNFFTHVRIRSCVLSWGKRQEHHLEDLF